MKKHILPFLLMAISVTAFGQAEELDFLGNWQKDGLPGAGWVDNIYNEVWGVAINNSEIAVIGSALGTHFIDVTDPTNPVEIEAAYVVGGTSNSQVIHRDYHDKDGYLYAVADEGNASTLQVIDISNLPDSTTVVYDSQDIFRRSHNVFIEDGVDRLYVCGGSAPGSGGFNLKILDITDPANPVEMTSIPNADFTHPYVHDIFVVNDIAYLNCGNDGFYVVDYTDVTSPILLGTMTNYPQSGYNHSGWLTEEGAHYYLADETHGMDLKVVDVCDMEDIQVTKTFNADVQAATSIPHNLIVKCDRLYVSYYYDGLRVFDISDRGNPELIAYYDTFDGADTDFYEGAWGLYPDLPSGNILISDMQTGLYIVSDAPGALNCNFDATQTCNPSSITDNNTAIASFNTYPQPADEALLIDITTIEAASDVQVGLIDLNGRQIQGLSNVQLTHGDNSLRIDVASLPAGFYFLSISGETVNFTSKVIIE